jgi:hypothetical protein
VKRAPSPGSLAILIGAVVAFVGSFLDVYKIGGNSSSAWDSDFFPLLTLPALLCAEAAVLVALAGFTDVRLPAQVLGISLGRWMVVSGLWAAIMMLGFLIGDPVFDIRGVDIGVDRAVGFWLMLIGSIAVAIGAVVRTREAQPTA